MNAFQRNCTCFPESKQGVIPKSKWDYARREKRLRKIFSLN